MPREMRWYDQISPVHIQTEAAKKSLLTKHDTKHASMFSPRSHTSATLMADMGILDLESMYSV